MNPLGSTRFESSWWKRCVQYYIYYNIIRFIYREECILLLFDADFCHFRTGHNNFPINLLKCRLLQSILWFKSFFKVTMFDQFDSIESKLSSFSPVVLGGRQWPAVMTKEPVRIDPEHPKTLEWNIVEHHPNKRNQKM